MTSSGLSNAIPENPAFFRVGSVVMQEVIPMRILTNTVKTVECFILFLLIKFCAAQGIWQLFYRRYEGLSNNITFHM
jgi:hypothetical protein